MELKYGSSKVLFFTYRDYDGEVQMDVSRFETRYGLCDTIETLFKNNYVIFQNQF